MKRILLLFLEFVVLSVPLTWAWRTWLHDPYDHLLFEILDALYVEIGAQHAGRGPVGHRFVSYVPFLVLVAITPQLNRRRLLWGSLLGSLAIFFSHLLLLLVSDVTYTIKGGGTDTVATLFPFLLLTDGLPLLIWFVLARDFLSSIVPGLRELESEARN
ncbi:MAG: hypothetical protein JRH16_04405 [Deltaproteobacteria bacterium]|nr:hypothetical protein [Deltaproteobacteria bacterium]MBW2363054.1 hypothetical protein [Deltaproteobacteria bacterium]